MSKKKLPPKSTKLKKNIKKPKSAKKIISKTTGKNKTIAKPKTIACLDQSDDKLKFYLTELTTGAVPFIFDYAPKDVSWKSVKSIAEFKTQGNIQQPMYFSYGENKKLNLSEIMFLENGTKLPHDQLNQLQIMSQPRGTALKIFQLNVGSARGGKFVARTYGSFVITALDIKEVMRDVATGKTLRASVNLELTEIASYQKDTKRDLSVPRSIVPNIPQEFKAAVAAEKASSGKLSNNETKAPIKPGDTLGAISGQGQLGFTFSLPGLSVTDTLKKKGWKPGKYPKNILDAFSLGPWNSANRTVGSSCVVGVSGLSTVLKPKGSGGFLSDRDSILCPISTNYGMTLVDGNTQNILVLKCTEKGREGNYYFQNITSPQINNKEHGAPVTGKTAPTPAPLGPLAPKPTDPVALSITPASTGGNTKKAVIKSTVKIKGNKSVFIDLPKTTATFTERKIAGYSETIKVRNLSNNQISDADLLSGYTNLVNSGVDPSKGIEIIGERGSNKASDAYWRYYDKQVAKNNNPYVLADLAEIKSGQGVYEKTSRLLKALKGKDKLRK